MQSVTLGTPQEPKGPEPRQAPRMTWIPQARGRLVLGHHMHRHRPPPGSKVSTSSGTYGQFKPEKAGKPKEMQNLMSDFKPSLGWIWRRPDGLLLAPPELSKLKTVLGFSGLTACLVSMSAQLPLGSSPPQESAPLHRRSANSPEPVSGPCRTPALRLSEQSPGVWTQPPGPSCSHTHPHNPEELLRITSCLSLLRAQVWGFPPPTS